jgi:tetratricopeptide (TPR) repeat protein
MSRFSLLIPAAALAAAVLLVTPPPAQAQIGSTMRGLVTTPDGQPIPEVNVEFKFKGESRVPIVKHGKTDKKGQFVRVGLQSGEWQVTFTKVGFLDHSINTWLSGDALSEVPPVVLAPAPAGQKTASTADEAEALKKQREKEKELGATYAQALEALRAGDGAKAEGLLKQVVAVNPAIAEVHYNLGYSYMLQNNADAAEASFRKGIEVNSSKPDSYIALSTLLASKGRGQEGFELLDGIKGLMPADARFQFALGVAASNIGKDAEAVEAFTKVVELDPANAEARYYLGTLTVAKDVPQAIGHLEAYLAAAPADAPNRATAQALLDALKKKAK